jgi:hypothetical protein
MSRSRVPVSTDDSATPSAACSSAAPLCMRVRRPLTAIGRAVDRYFVHVDQRLSRYACTHRVVDSSCWPDGDLRNSEPFLFITLPRPPIDRAWPFIREVAVVMCAALALVVLAPPAFDRLPLFHVDPNAPGWEQAGAALAGASILAFLVPSNFALYAAMYVRRWRRGVHLFAAFWLSLTLGIPTALLLLRCCAAAGVALDAPVLVLVVWNLVVPCCVLVQVTPSRRAPPPTVAPTRPSHRRAQCDMSNVRHGACSRACSRAAHHHLCGGAWLSGHARSLYCARSGI